MSPPPADRQIMIRARRIVPLAMAAVAVAAFAALRPGPFRSTITSPQALLRIAGGIVVLRLVSLLLRRLGQSELTRMLVVGGGVVVVLALVVAPYFRDERVVEALPTSGSDLNATLGPASTAPPPSTSVTSAVPSPGAAAVSPTVPAAAPVTTTTSPPAPVTTSPPQPEKLSSGQLRGIGHRASGQASVYRLADGAHLVRLEDIDVENGPDYVVYLVPGADRRSPDGGVSLGALKGNQGSQNYPLPAGTDIAEPKTVLIWCRAFAVPVAQASLLPV